MSKIALIGCGWMGQAIAFALHKLGHELVLIEYNSEHREEADVKWQSLGIQMPKWNERFNGHFFHNDRNKDIDLVISAAPYQANWPIATLAIEHGIDYCDLGGNPRVSNDIQNFASAKNRCRVFTDLGLAPGYINIVASDMVDEMPDITDIHLFVGGLPLMPKGRLKYNLVFSIEGLINEYTGKCHILKDGEVVEVDALTGVEPYGSAMETFYTKGGLSQTLDFMKSHTNVQNCSYKTLRYTGHADYIRFLIEDCQLRHRELANVIHVACPPTKKDVVYMAIDYTRPKFGNRKAAIIPANEHWTAMQIGTSFPAVAVASIMADTVGMGGPVMGYEDIKYKDYLSVLNVIDDKVPWELKDV